MFAGITQLVLLPDDQRKGDKILLKGHVDAKNTPRIQYQI